MLFCSFNKLIGFVPKLGEFCVPSFGKKYCPQLGQSSFFTNIGTFHCHNIKIKHWDIYTKTVHCPKENIVPIYSQANVAIWAIPSSYFTPRQIEGE